MPTIEAVRAYLLGQITAMDKLDRDSTEPWRQAYREALADVLKFATTPEPDPLWTVDGRLV